MEFGRVPESELMTIDFSLPKEPAANKVVLNNKNPGNFKIYVGCAKWGRKEWKGKIYPPKTKEACFQDEYLKHYNSIELNATHYQLYPVEQIQKWDKKAAGLDFKFAPKVYKNISHFGSLSNKKFLTDAFLESAAAFGSHLGPVFLQLNERFGPKRRDELIDFLSSLPIDLNIFLEVRHPGWYLRENAQEFFEKLTELNVGAVITDTAGRRDCCHMQLTTSKTFIRFVGNSLHATDYSRIDSWIRRIKYWKAKGLKELYFFMHMHDEALSPELTVYLIQRLNKECKVNLRLPQFTVDEEHPVLF